MMPGLACFLRARRVLNSRGTELVQRPAVPRRVEWPGQRGEQLRRAFGLVAFAAAGPVAAALGARAVLAFGGAWSVATTLAVLTVPAIRRQPWPEPPASHPPEMPRAAATPANPQGSATAAATKLKWCAVIVRAVRGLGRGTRARAAA